MAEEEGAQTRTGLFAQCTVVVIKNDGGAGDGGLEEEDGQKVIETLKLHDAEARLHGYDSDGELSLEGVTHIICSTFDFPDYDRATEMLIAVVKPGWVEASLARNKLANPRQYSPDPRLFMTDVVACCADLPNGDADAIAGGILAMGGMYTTKLTSQVTHIVALTLEPEQCEYAIKAQLRVKIVLPHWFDDCLKLGRKIDEQPYLLPDPEILNPQKQSKILSSVAPRRNNLSGAVHPDPAAGTGSPPPPSATTAAAASAAAAADAPEIQRRGQKVFKNKKVMLSHDLGIGPRLRDSLEELILGGGGSLSKSMEQCDMYICKYREGNEYKWGSRAGKQVGNLAWLYYLITTDRWTSPLRRLLHYPIARGGVPGFSNFKISLSNYTGEARTYLENLITVAGGQYTKTLKQENTHLITAHTMSEKCAAAKDWGIEMVNHLWLEESYAKWKVQSVSNSRYTHFPRRTNLGEVVGQTQIDKEVLEQKFFPPGSANNTEGDAQEAKKVVAKATETKANNSKNKKRSEGAVTRTSKAAATSLVVAAADKENMTPSRTGSGRKSKEAAAVKLLELTPDIALYEREKKRVGGVVYGGRRSVEVAAGAGGGGGGRGEGGGGGGGGGKSETSARKRSIHEASETETVRGVQKAVETGRKEAKKAKKTGGLPAVEMRLLVSGYAKWQGGAKVEDEDRAKLRRLGIQVTTDASKATHLAAPHILRTLKFVAAMAYGPIVVSTSYIDACLEQDELLDPHGFLLEDKENEKKLGFSLQETRARAQEKGQQLLRKRVIYCMDNVHGGFEAYESIVKANGGQCMRWRNRKGTMVPSRRADSEAGSDDDVHRQNEVFLLSGDEPGNQKLWERFRQMVEHSRQTPRIVSTDWLIESALCQKVMPAERYPVGGNPQVV